MQASDFLKPTHSIAALRMLMGIVFLLHAAARIYNNSVPGFGNLLEEKGFPFGFYLAWAVTVFELAGSVLLFFRKFVKLFCIGEIIILITGIVTLHWPNGWFVVEIAMGGIEYSVVLITILIAIFFAEKKEKRMNVPLV
jgi:putative oxidoreductase